jgi:hypothetical protein
MTPAADAAVCQCGHPRSEHDVPNERAEHDTRIRVCHGKHGAWACTCFAFAPPKSVTAKLREAVDAVRPAFVADVNRPDDHQHDGTLPAEFCEDCAAALAAVSDREGATEQLADLLAGHSHWVYAKHSEDRTTTCVCGALEIGNLLDAEAPNEYDEHRAHVAAVIVAAGWEKRDE